MKSINIAINGFGRIGRQALRVAWQKKNIKIVGINDIAEAKILAHLFKYDTSYGTSAAQVLADEKNIIIDGVKIPVFAERDPSALPWGKLKVDVVLECTGRFTKKEDAALHLKAGAKRVIISAPGKDGAPTYVAPVNTGELEDESALIINNASCTTNCIVPVMAVLEENFGVEKALLTTVHAYTAEQNLHDAPPPGLKSGDLRRARAAAANIVPTTTGAAIATGEVIPALKGKFDGLSLRVPVTTVSLSDITALLKTKVTKEIINKTFIEAAAHKKYRGILGVTAEPLVSSDFIGNTHSAIVDLGLTNVVDGNLVKIIAWYDNETGYASRLVELAEDFA